MHAEIWMELWKNPKLQEEKVTHAECSWTCVAREDWSYLA